MYGCLPLLLFSIIVIIFSAVIGLLRLLFGVRRTAKAFRDAMGGGAQQSQRTGNSSTHTGSSRQSSTTGTAPQHKNGKFFGKDEGEYVDFEEVK